MSKQTKKRHDAEHEAHAAAEQASHEDDLIVVPKGTSRLKFFVTVGLMLFVLVIFTVGDQVQSGLGGIFGGGGGERISMTWVHPGTGEKFEIGEREFINRLATLERLTSVGAYYPQSRRDNPKGRAEDEDVATWLIYDRLAEDAGVGVSHEELRERLKLIFINADNLRFMSARMNVSTPQMESDIRSTMRAEKYQRYLSVAATVADPERVVELWEEAHPEYSFQYVEVAAEDYEERALAEVPDDETLLAWFHELPQFQQRAHYTEDRVRAEVAYVSLADDFDATALFEAYPPAEDIDLEKQAKDYYNTYSNVRFRVEEEEEEGEPENAEGDGTEEEGPTDSPGDDEDTSTGDQDATGEDEDTSTGDQDTTGEDEATEEEAATEEDDQKDPNDPSRWYKPFDEVEEICKREAPLFAAISAWQADVLSRANADEEVDFRAEAEELGLSVDFAEEPRTRDELTEIEPWGGNFISGQLSFAREGFLAQVVVEDQALVVGRIVEKLPGEEPPFEDIREDVAELWAKDHAVTLAVAELEKVRDELGDRPEEDEESEDEESGDDESGDEDSGDEDSDEGTGVVGASEEGTEAEQNTDEGADAEEDEPWYPTATADEFRAAAEKLGFTVVDRPWLEMRNVPNDDYTNASKADLHIRVTNELFELEEGQVAAAARNAQGTHAILVRYAGQRPADIANISPRELGQLRNTVVQEQMRDFQERNFWGGAEHLKERYSLDLLAWHKTPDEGEGEDGEEGAAEGAPGPE